MLPFGWHYVVVLRWQEDAAHEMAFERVTGFDGRFAALATFEGKFGGIEAVTAFLFFGTVAAIALGGEDGLHFSAKCAVFR